MKKCTGISWWILHILPLCILPSFEFHPQPQPFTSNQIGNSMESWKAHEISRVPLVREERLPAKAALQWKKRTYKQNVGCLQSLLRKTLWQLDKKIGINGIKKCLQVWNTLKYCIYWGVRQNQPRCYPQQRSGNNASKENLRARLFPILGEVSWCFEIFAVTTSELQGATARKPCPKLKFPETLPEPESEPSKLTGYCPKHSP